jgi:hypothetical protein
MSSSPPFDLAAAHHYFAAYCFNAAWDLIEKPSRTADEDRAMVELAQASIFHWRARANCTDKNLSIGYWQASRVHALTGNAREALRLAEISLAYSPGSPPYFVAYAHEAMARTLKLLGRNDEAAAHVAAARALVPQVKTQQDRDRLTADLDQLD